MEPLHTNPDTDPASISLMPALSEVRGPRLGLPVRAVRIAERFHIPAHTSAAVFDLNGTIGNSEAAYREALRRAAENVSGMRISADDWARVRTSWHMSSMGACRAAARALVRQFPEARSAFRPERLLAEQQRIIKHERDALPLAPVAGMQPLLERLVHVGARVWLVTGSDEAGAELILGRFALRQYFHGILCTGGLERSWQKPHPHSYREALHRQGCHREIDMCFAFEDSVKGALAAYQAGINVLVRVEHNRLAFAAALREKAREQGMQRPEHIEPNITLLSSWSAVSVG